MLNKSQTHQKTSSGFLEEKSASCADFPKERSDGTEFFKASNLLVYDVFMPYK